MTTRLSRAEQNDRNRGLLLAAALRVFTQRGYHAATLEQIAEEAGFSKGAVYSRFDSKADMFLALIAGRITDRAAQNAAAAEQAASSGDLTALLDLAARAELAAPGWRLLVTEFRIHAARDAELGRRYAELHARTVDGLASALRRIAGWSGRELPVPGTARQLAELLMALETGLALEELANPAGAPGLRQLPVLLGLLSELFAAGVPAGTPAAPPVTNQVRQP
jgi:AcrR family transcriptional regulator